MKEAFSPGKHYTQELASKNTHLLYEAFAFADNLVVSMVYLASVFAELLHECLLPTSTVFSQYLHSDLQMI